MNRRQKIVQEQFLNNEEAVIGRLKTVYNKSLSDITGKVKTLDSSIAGLQKALDDIGEDGIGNLAAAYLKGKQHITPEEAKETLQSMLQSKVYQKNYQQALQKQVGGILDTMHEKEYKTVSDYLTQSYEDGFIGTMFDLQGQGIPLCFPLDQEAMVRAVQLDSKISQGLYSRLGEDVSLLKKKITAQVSRGIATGMSFQQVAQQLSAYTNIGYNNAVRIARTEGHRIQVQGTMDACYKAKDRGADVVKQWDATLDDSTRESHVAVDGEIRELDEKFSNGLMFPGDPSGGAAEVVNCRCALLQRARWALDDSFTKYDGFSGELKQFENIDTYKQFKEAYYSKENMSYMDYMKELEDRHQTKNFNTIINQMTDSEYKHFLKLQEARPQFSGMYRSERRKTSEGVFETFNNTKGDSIRPHSIMKDLKTSDVGRETLKYIQDENVPVHLMYGFDNPEGHSGVYDPLDDVIIVFCDQTKTIKETTLTVIHEARHRKLGSKGTFEEEVECFKTEVLHTKGQLTEKDISDIINHVRKAYPDLV